MGFIRNGVIPLLLVLPAALSAQRIYIGNNATMTINGGANLVLNNTGFTSDGGFRPDTGTVVFAGDNNTLIGGESTPAFYKMTIRKSSGVVLLTGPANISGTLTMNNGHLVLNNYTLSLGSTGTIAGEKDQSRVVGDGYITASRILDAPKFANLGNLGLSITSTAYLGTVTVMRSNTTRMLPSGPSIARTFTVYNNTGGGDARMAGIVPLPASPVFNLGFHYLDAELYNNIETGLNVWSGGPVIWTFLGRTSQDTASNLVTVNGVRSLGTFNLGPAQPAATDSATLFPNPTHDQSTLVIYRHRSINDAIGLYNASGTLLQQMRVLVQPGATTITWDLSRYGNGLYYLVSAGNLFKSIMIIRQ